MKRPALLLLGFLCACAGAADTPYSTSIGELAPGSTIVVKAARADVNAYKPKLGDPANRFTVAATALSKTSPPAPTLRPNGTGVSITASQPLRSLLVRVPDRVKLDVNDRMGNVTVTDITGSANVRTGSGNVTIMISGYAQAHTDDGTINLTMGSTDWPGELRVTNGTGDIVVYVNENAKFRARLHTGDGTLFTDFAYVRGTSSGTSETIDAPINGGASRTLTIETQRGTIRLLRLTPQA